VRTAGGRKHAPRDEGAAAVEFALVSVLLFTVLFGILQYGFLFFQMQAASSTARQVARLASVGISDCANFGTAARTVAAENEVPSDGFSVTADFEDGSGTAARPEWVDVSVRFSPTDFGAPFVPFPGGMTRTARARVESLGAEVGGCS
jgi:Flp pilus assembly protein TadG